MEVERYVTEWGFPVLCWRDRISNMRGHPQNIRPRIDTQEIARTLWINFNGVDVVANDAGGPVLVGRWHEWEGHRNFSFHSYKPGTEGVVEVHAHFAFLKGFRVVDSRETNALAVQPLKNTLPGLSIVADFRYGLTLPLTCVWHRDDKARKDVEALAQLCAMLFLPLVGQSLTDEQLGFRPRA